MSPDLHADARDACAEASAALAQAAGGNAALLEAFRVRHTAEFISRLLNLRKLDVVNVCSFMILAPYNPNAAADVHVLHDKLHLAMPVRMTMVHY